VKYDDVDEAVFMAAVREHFYYDASYEVIQEPVRPNDEEGIKICDATLKQLEDGVAVIREKKHWTTCAAARNAYGAHCDVHSPRAFCFCSAGALLLVLPRGGGVPDYGLMALGGFLRHTGAGENVVVYNDAHTHEEVVAAWDDTIASLRRTRERLIANKAEGVGT